MFSEIVIPKNNEAEFIEIALKLGIKKLYFLYDFDDYDEEKTQSILDSIKNNINVEIGFLVNHKNLNKAFKKSKLLVVKSSEHDRFFIETKKIKIIYGFEETYKKDYLNQRASGLNHTLCELAQKNNVAIGFSYSLFFHKTPELKAMLMGRMMQNIQLCKKYKLKIVLSSFAENPFHLRSYYDVKSLFSLLGFVGKSPTPL